MILTLSAVVVFVTTYMLIMPALTLDEDMAAEQGGIDVLAISDQEKPGESQIVETALPHENDDADDTEPAAGIITRTVGKSSISVGFEANAKIPQGTGLSVSDLIKEDVDDIDVYRDKALEAATKNLKNGGVTNLDVAGIYDIALLSEGEEIEPSAPVDVTIDFEKRLDVSKDANAVVVHFTEDAKGRLKASVLDENDIDIDINDNRLTQVSFEADSFSVYAVVYTVDFHYDVDGETYDFSIPGGGFISLSDVVDKLGLAQRDDSVKSDKEDSLNTFVSQVSDVKFSDRKLMSVSKVEKDTTVGDIKDSLDLECEYSAELTEQEIAEINAQTIKAGDWALISLKPFTSEESLTVTMKNGDQFVVKVTDASGTAIKDGSKIDTGIYYIYSSGEVDKVKYNYRFLLNQNSGSNNYSLENDLPTTDDKYKWEVYKNTDGTITVKSPDQEKYLALSSAVFSDNEVGLSFETDGGVKVKNGSSYMGFDKTNGYKISTSATKMIFYRIGDLKVASKINYQALPNGWGSLSKTSETIEIGGVSEGATATAANGKYFVGWFDQNYNLVGTNETFIPAGDLISNGATYTALFSNYNGEQLVFRVNDPNMGTIGGSDNWKHSGNFPLNNTSAGFIQGRFSDNGKSPRYGLTATPSMGSYFDHWEMNGHRLPYGASLKNDTDISEYKNTDGDPNVLTAVFRDYYTFTVRTDSPSHGLVSGTDQYGEKVYREESFVARSQKQGEDYVNFNSLSASVSGGFQFDHWELRDGNNVIESISGSFVGTKRIKITKEGLELVACYKESPASSGSSDNSEGRKIAELLEKWKDDLTKEPLKVNKTAKVVDYPNRIYQIDVNTSSQRKAVETDVAVNFIVDTSRSMYFPASITKVDDYPTTNLIGWLNNKSHDNVYFIIGDKDSTATMYAVYYDKDKKYSNENTAGNWMYVDASYYNADDGKTKEPLFVRDITDGKAKTSGSTNTRTLSGEIFTAPERDAGALWTRLDYLFMAVEQATRVLYELDPQAQIGLTTFNANAEYKGLFGKTQPEIEAKLRSIATEGGTNQTKGLNTAKDSGLFSSTNTKNQYAILVTDGAPVQSDSSSTNWTEIGKAAEQLKNVKNANNKSLILYTLGVSLSHVGTNAGNLNAVATDSNKAYQADTGEQIANAIEGIVESMLAQATLYGSVTDTLDSAFYPTTQNGIPIEAGIYDVNGTKLNAAPSNELTPYYEWSQNNGIWTITWHNQQFAPENGNAPGWAKTFYVKAKENYLGGNTVKTNSDTDDIVSASGFVKSDGTISYFDHAVSSDFDTPYVNVDELQLNKHHTSVTVNLGEEVNSMQALKDLYNSIEVSEVVTASGTDNRVTGELDASREKEHSSDFLLNTVAPMTDALWKELLGKAPDANGVRGTVEIPYSAYGHNSGKITVTLKQELTENEPGVELVGGNLPGAHVTTVVGAGVEKYTLTVTYVPNGVDSSKDYHTTPGGQPGNPTNNMESVNTHVVNVLDTGQEVVLKKVGVNNTDQTKTQTNLAGAKFRIYEAVGTNKDQKGDEVKVNGETLGKLTSADGTGIFWSGKLPTGTYLIEEIEAPAGYNMLSCMIKMTVAVSGVTLNYVGTTGNPSRLYNAPVKNGNGWEIAIINTSGKALPATGGAGTKLFTIIGLSLMLGAGFVLAIRRRRAV